MDGKRFYGTFTPRMDDKGRVTIPARYRDEFRSGAMLVRGQDRCLYLFTTEGFDAFAESVINADVTDERARGFQRYMLANSDEQTPDLQGRIGVPGRMRDYASLDKDVVVVGVGRRMELWDADLWTAYENAHEDEYAAPAPGLLT